MEMTQLKTNADPMLQAAAQTAQKSPQTTQSTKKDDFGKLVRQRQQDAKSTKDPKQAAQDTQTVKKNADTPTDDGQEIPREQYALAAAMMLTPNIELITINILPEEQRGEVEIAPVFMPDMQIEAVTDIPVESTQETGEQTFLRQDNDTAPETFETHVEESFRFQETMVFDETEEQTDETVVVEDAQWSTPVFGYMDAAPVKVASTQEAPIPLETDEGVHQMSTRIAQLVTEADGSSRVEFTLIPASLGKVTVQITSAADGSLHVQLNATTMRAADLLEKNSDTLQRLLGAGTRPEVKIEVRTDTEAPPLYYLNPDANQQQQQRQQQQNQQRQRRQQPRRNVEFLHQLRLGLTGIDNVYTM